MAYEQRDNSGSTFTNDRKESENHPDFTGKCMVGGKLYYMSTWQKEKNGALWYSHAFKAVDEVKRPEAKQPEKEPASDSFDDDIPF